MVKPPEARSPQAPRGGPDHAHERPRQHSAQVTRQRLDPGVLDEIIHRVVEVAQPDRIILFGSTARGEIGPDSDIDLLVIKSRVEHRRRLAGHRS